MTKERYDQIISKIKECITLYENTVDPDNVYNLFLANSEVLQFSYKKQFIPHLLGIDLNYLVSKGVLKADNSYDLLKKFMDDEYSIYLKIKSGIINPDNLFSSYIDDKLEVFKYQIKNLMLEEVYVVCKYDKTKNYGKKEIDSNTSDYYLCRIMPNDRYSILGFVKNDGNMYGPRTSILDTDKSKIQEIISGQEVTYVTGMKIENRKNGFSTTPYYLYNESKKNTIKRINELAESSNAVPNYKKDTLRSVMACIKEKNNIFNMNEILSELSKSIESSIPFDLDDISDEVKQSTTEEIKNLVNRYNNLVCGGITNNDDTYSKLKEKTQKLQMDNEKLNEEIQTLKEEKERLLKEKELLEQENQKSKEFKNKIFELVNNEKSE